MAPGSAVHPMIGMIAVAALTLCLTAGIAAGDGPVVLAAEGVARSVLVVAEGLLPRTRGPAAPMHGRYLRLRNAADRTMLAEVEAFSGNTNVALHRPATQQGQWGGCTAANAVDGDQNPDHDRCAVGDVGGWWEVDLGQTVAIDRIVAWNTDARNAYRMANLTVSVLDETRRPMHWLQVREAQPSWEFDSSLYRTGDAANARTVQALKDLRHYLGAATGAEFVVKREGEESADETCVYFGSAASRKLGLNLDTLAPDEWVMRTRDGDLFLCGGRRLGDSRAVYHFLEDIVGVRFWGEEDVDVPSRPALAIPATDLRGRPAFDVRASLLSAYTQQPVTVQEMRQGLMRLDDLVVPGVGGGDGSLLIALEMDADRNYGKAQSEAMMARHPEWYAKDGTGKIRGLDYGVRTCFFRDLCYSHITPEAEDLIANNLIAGLRLYEDECRAARRPFPPIPVVMLCRDDAVGVCECPDCAASPLSFTDRYIEFLNRIAARLTAAYPRLRLLTLAYLGTESPPTAMRPADCLMVKYAMTGQRYDRAFSDPANAGVISKLNGWGAVAPLTLWRYETTAALQKGQGECSSPTDFQLPAPTVWFYGELLRSLQERKGAGVISEIDHVINRDMGELRDWIWAKLIEDPSRDDMKLVETFLAEYYGPAAPPIRRYLQYVRQRAGEGASSYGNWQSLNMVRYFDQDFFVKSQGFFAEAEQTLEASPEPARGKYLRRVRWAWASPTRAFLSWWSLTAQEWVGSGNRIEDYPLDHDAILAKYRTVLDDYARFRGMPLSDDWRAKHFQVLGARYVAMPLPEAFAEMPQAQVYDFPVASDELIPRSDVVRISDDPERGSVLVVRPSMTELWPIRFYNNYNTKIVQEIGSSKTVHWNEYAWYYAGRYDGTGPGSWRGNVMYLFYVDQVSYGATGLIALGAADARRTPFDGWVEMMVLPGEDNKPSEIRVARVIMTTGQLTPQLNTLKQATEAR